MELLDREGLAIAAANLTVRPGSFPHTEAMTWFAKAIGAARSKQFDQARAHLAKLAPLRDALTAKNDAYWAGQVEIQRKTAEGVILFQEAMGSGASSAAALELLRAAADAEDGTEKSPVTPGSLVPARELYAESLVMSRRFSDALAEFEKTLTRESGRFRSIAGAMRAAQAANNTAKAKKYAVDLLALAKSASPGRPEIEEAKKLAK
jgi:hypothetical protein